MGSGLKRVEGEERNPREEKEILSFLSSDESMRVCIVYSVYVLSLCSVLLFFSISHSRFPHSSPCTRFTLLLNCYPLHLVWLSMKNRIRLCFWCRKFLLSLPLFTREFSLSPKLFDKLIQYFKPKNATKLQLSAWGEQNRSILICRQSVRHHRHWIDGTEQWRLANRMLIECMSLTDSHCITWSPCSIIIILSDTSA